MDRRNAKRSRGGRSSRPGRRAEELRVALGLRAAIHDDGNDAESLGRDVTVGLCRGVEVT